MKEDRSEEVTTKQDEGLSLSWREQRYQRFYQIVDRLVAELQEHAWHKTGKPKRRLKGDGLKKLHYSVECLVRDCIAVVLQRKRKSEAAIRKGQYYYSSGRPDKMLTYSIHIERAFEGLVELGYLDITKKGYFDRKGRKDGTPTSRLTRYIASDDLLGLFTVSELKVLPAIIPSYFDPELIKVRIKEKDQDGVIRKKSVSFIDTAETVRMRTNLEFINNALAKHWYDLEIPDEELSALQKKLAGDTGNERSIRMDQRSLHRVFNDPELTTGGRFYGGWWQNIPKGYRKHLVVNGKKMVELDYSNQHPTILYAMEGKERPADCYSDVIKLDSLPEGLHQCDLRAMVKSAFNAMLNSLKPLKQAPGEIKPSIFGLKWSEVSDAITNFHNPIAHHFYTGVGLRLQRIDSDIAEIVMLRFTKMGYGILPLHDSFLMHHGFENELPSIMEEAFEQVEGAIPKIDLKTSKNRKAIINPVMENEFGALNDLSIEKLLLEMDVGHINRLSAFRAL